MTKHIAIALTTLASFATILPAADARPPLNPCQYDNSCSPCQKDPSRPECRPR